MTKLAHLEVEVVVVAAAVEAEAEAEGGENIEDIRIIESQSALVRLL